MIGWIEEAVEAVRTAQMRRLYSAQDGATYSWGARAEVSFIGREVADQGRHLFARLTGLSMAQEARLLRRMLRLGDVLVSLADGGRETWLVVRIGERGGAVYKEEE